MVSHQACDEAGLRALVALTELPGVGERRARRVVDLARARGLGIAEVLDLPAPVLASDYFLPRAAIERLAGAGRQQHEEHCRRLWDRLRVSAVVVTRPGETSYPARWQERSVPPPPVAYAYGNPRVLAAPTLAPLSSRTLDNGTVTATAVLVRRATEDEFTVVSGGMKSTHRVAAVAVRGTGAPRVIVLDRGLFAVFGNDMLSDPFGLGPGRALLDLSTTLVLSPFRPWNHAGPANGRRRDRLVADLADVVVAVHARPGGEIERICLRVLDQGRCVLSWQGENAGLVEAGAVPIWEADLRAGFARFL